MNLYTVKEGKHDFKLWGFLPVLPTIYHKKEFLAWRVDFDHTIKYTLPGAEQHDWNKGGGLSFNFFNNHKESAMWSFRWLNNEIQFGAYAHVDGNVVKAKTEDNSEVFYTLQPEDWFFIVMEIDYEHQMYLWYFVDKYQQVQSTAIIPFGHNKKWAKSISSWFGGNNSAPQNINMWLAKRDGKKLTEGQRFPKITPISTAYAPKLSQTMTNETNIQLGNQESIELAVFLAEFINGIYLTRQDGKVTWLDTANFIKAALSAPAAFTGIKEIPAEFKDWTVEEKAEVLASFTSRLRFDTDAKLEEEVEAVFQSMLNLAKAVDELLTKNEEN